MFYRCSKLAVMFAVLLLAATAGATTWRVPADHPTIAAGLAAAAPSDTVLVSPGTYYEHGLVMSDGVVLRGETGHHADVVIDGQQLGRVFFCGDLSPGSAFEDLTITGGFSDGTGNDGIGGGVLCEYSTLRFSDCAVVGNHAVVGGGMTLRYGADVLFEDCVFRENTAVSSGGALRVFQSAPVLRRCQFIDNAVEMDGAAIFSGAAGMLIEDSFFQGNEAGIWGGALVLLSPNEGDLVVRGCTFVDNTAIWSGSAIFSGNQCPFSLENCVVVGNRESEALYITDSPAFKAITCCNVHGNTDGNYGGTLMDQTGLNGNISLSPVFCNPGAGDFRLAADSPCLPENNDCGVLMGAFGLGCGVSSVAMPSKSVPLLTVYPNPFNPSTEITFSAPGGRQSTVMVHDVRGQRIAVLYDGPAVGGSQSVTWNAKDLPSGIYLVRVTSGKEYATEKIVLLK